MYFKGSFKISDFLFFRRQDNLLSTPLGGPFRDFRSGAEFFAGFFQTKPRWVFT